MIAGLLFGIWPLFMNRSGLSGHVSAACYSLMALAFVLPFALYGNGFTIPQANWNMVLAAGIIGAAGLLCFNSVLAGALPKEVGALFLCMIISQATVPATYQVIMDKHLSSDKAVGFILAALSIYFLLKPRGT